MARDWVKLWTCITRDPYINGLDPAHGWNWTRMLALAGDREDRGRIGTVCEVAYVLRVDEADIHATVAALDGRIEDRDGELYFRDWHDWQVASNKERQAAWRERQTGDSNGSAPPVTDRNESNVRARGCETRPDQKRQEQKVAPDKPARPDQEVFGALCDWRRVEPDSLPGNVRGRLNKLGGDLRKAGFGAGDIREADRRWWREHWKGKKREPPTYREVEEWMAQCAADGDVGMDYT